MEEKNKVNRSANRQTIHKRR